MKSAMNLFFAITLLLFTQLGLAQGPKPLVEPEMEVFDVYGMEPRILPNGLEARIVGLATINTNQVTLKKGMSTPSHNHAFEQIVLVLEGQIKAFSGEKEFILGPGEMFTAPAFVHHTYTALEDTKTFEVFGPGGSFTPNTSVVNNH